MSKILLHGIDHLVTMDADLGELTNAWILVDGPAFAAVGTGAPPADVEDARKVDLSGRLVTPGFVNCHHHFYQTLTRNVPSAANAKLFDWLLALYDVWAEMTPEDLRDASAVAASELLLSGCTTALDHLYLFPRGANEYFDAEVEGVATTGLRLHLTRGSMSRGRKDGGLPPDSVVQDEKTILAHCEEVVARHHDGSDFSMLRVVLAPCSPFSVTEDLMRASAEMAREKDLTLHTHLAETKDEERYCLENYGVRPVALCERCGWMNERAIFAHSVHVNDAEIELYAKTRVGVAHCPTSNMRLGSGIAPIVPMLRAGVKVGLGVDGSASNDASHFADEIRSALLLQRVKYGADALTTREALYLATVGGAEVLGRKDIGRIAPGMAADLAAWDLSGIFTAGALHDPPGILALCHVDRADFVMVNGRPVVEGGEVTTVDLPALVARHNDNARALLARADR